MASSFEMKYQKVFFTVNSLLLLMWLCCLQRAMSSYFALGLHMLPLVGHLWLQGHVTCGCKDIEYLAEGRDGKILCRDWTDESIHPPQHCQLAWYGLNALSYVCTHVRMYIHTYMNRKLIAHILTVLHSHTVLPHPTSHHHAALLLTSSSLLHCAQACAVKWRMVRQCWSWSWWSMATLSRFCWTMSECRRPSCIYVRTSSVCVCVAWVAVWMETDESMYVCSMPVSVYHILLCSPLCVFVQA